MSDGQCCISTEINTTILRFKSLRQSVVATRLDKYFTLSVRGPSLDVRIRCFGGK